MSIFTVRGSHTPENNIKRYSAYILLAIFSIYTLSSYSVALYGFLAEDPDSQTRLNRFMTYRESNAPATNFDPGDTVLLKTKLTYAQGIESPYSDEYSSQSPNFYWSTTYWEYYYKVDETRNCKVTIVVYYIEDGVVVPLDSYSEEIELQSGDSEDINIDFDIPDDAPESNRYYAKIFVWDDYLPEGGNEVLAPDSPASTIRQFSVGEVE